MVTDDYRRSVGQAPALAEPFVLIEPYRIETKDSFKAFDREGHQLVLDRTGRRGAALAFHELLADGMEPAWVAGRLTDTGGTLCLTPFTLATRDFRHLRL